MADLTAADVTVTLTQRNVDFTQFQKLVAPTLTFGDGAKTIPAGGIPLPALKSLGLNKVLNAGLVLPNGDGLSYLIDRTNIKLKVFSGTAGGPQVYNPGANDIRGGANTDSPTTDQTSKPLNADYVDTLHAVTYSDPNQVWSFSLDLQPDVPRNVCMILRGAPSTGSNIPNGTYNFVVTGLFRGAVQTETITFTFAAGNGNIAADKYRYKYGVKPFTSIASVTIVQAELNGLPTGLLVGVGIGTKLGLPTETFSNLEADITKLVLNDTAQTITGTFSATNKTVALGTLSNGDSVIIEYAGASTLVHMTGAAPAATSVQLLLLGE